jgi:FkbM family methyltransferase
MKIIEYKGVFCRNIAADKNMIKECNKHYKDFTLNSESRVLDLGTHVGGFAKICQDAGVQNYMGFEANDITFDILKQNIKNENYKIFHSAVSASEDKEISFHVNENPGSNISGSVIKKRGSRYGKNLLLTVKNTNFKDIIDEFQPTHIKMDIEGAEIEIIEKYDIGDLTQEFFVEVHKAKPSLYFYENLHPKILDQGFKLINAEPFVGFPGNNTTWSGFGYSGKGYLWGFNVFYKR